MEAGTGAERLVEATDRLEGDTPHRHVGPVTGRRRVLRALETAGLLIGLDGHDRTALAVGPHLARGEADRGIVEVRGESGRPSRLRPAVVVGERDDRGGRRRNADVARPCEARTLRSHHSKTRGFGDAAHGRIHRRGVHDDGLVFTAQRGADRGQRRFEERRTIAGAQDHRHPGAVGHVPIMAAPMAAPLVSVVIPTRDRVDRVVKALASVARQTWTAWEAIVVDDGSVDNTQAVLAAAAELDRRVHVVRHEQPQGGSAARNSGIAVAAGDMLAFLDDDDEWLPTKLAAQVDYLLERPGVGAVSCWQVIEDGSGLGPAVFRGPTAISLDNLYWDNFGGSASFCVWRRDAFDPEPRFDPALPSAQDWDVWLQCAGQSSVAVVPQVLCRYASHGGPRITGSSTARVDGRQRIVDRYRASMSDECVAYNEASIALIGDEAASSEATVLAGLLRRGHMGAAWALTSAAIAGRLGDRARDPGRGARQLHRVVVRLGRHR